MRKLLEWVRKFNTPLCYGIICAIFGVAFIVLPLVEPLALDILIIIAGVATVAIGVLTVAELDTADRGLAYYLNVAKTVAFIAVGIFLIVARSSLASHFCLALGVYILLRAVPVLIRVILFPESTKAVWWVQLILSLIEILLGAWLIFYPKWPHVLTGATLLFIAVELFIKKYKSDRPDVLDRSGTIYDPDFEDKS